MTVVPRPVHPPDGSLSITGTKIAGAGAVAASETSAQHEAVEWADEAAAASPSDSSDAFTIEMPVGRENGGAVAPPGSPIFKHDTVLVDDL